MKRLSHLRRVVQNLSALQITVAYLASSASWFLCSNLLIGMLPADLHSPAHHLRDGVFIALSSVILYLVASHCLVTFLYSRKQLQQSQTRFQALYENMTQGVIYLSDRGEIISANPAAEQILGRSIAELVGLRLRDIDKQIIQEDGSIYPWRDYPNLQALRYGRPIKNIILGVYNPQLQDYRWLKVDALPQFGHDSELPQEVFISLEDITAFRHAQQEIEQLAYYDTLTELPNRRLFMDRLSQSVNWAQRNNEQLALLFLDLDEFKAVNDRLGHAGGDQLLCEVARRLQHLVRKSDTVARLSGDEFVILLPAIHHDDDGAIMAQKMLASLAHPVSIQQQPVPILASIGIASYPTDADSAEALLLCADTAMYRAKKRGKHLFCRYNDL